MSLERVAAVLADADVYGLDKLVLLGVAHYSGPGGAWPSIATLATLAGVSGDVVALCLERLEQAGKVLVTDTLDGRRCYQVTS